MDVTRPTATATGKLAPPVLQPESSVRSDVRDDVRNNLRNAVRNDAQAPVKSSGYGLPCAHCRLYYPANLDTCPACNSKERVAAAVGPIIRRLRPHAELLP